MQSQACSTGKCVQRARNSMHELPHVISLDKQIICLYIHIYMCVCIYIYIYIYVHVYQSYSLLRRALLHSLLTYTNETVSCIQNQIHEHSSCNTACANTSISNQHKHQQSTQASIMSSSCASLATLTPSETNLSFANTVLLNACWST
jgi:hypothetical protein